ncbi:MAG: hypothetical protein ACI9EF_002987 [Pseudohongiellaceae bacterium]|jgi:hypothetical protein
MFIPKSLLAPIYVGLLMLVAALPCYGQSADGTSDGQPDANPMPLMSASEMTTTFFTPQHASGRDVNDFMQLARSVHGRDISIEEKGGYFARPVSNLQTVGDALVIFEDAASSQRILAWCQRIDKEMQKDQSSGSALVVAEWRPKNISLTTGYEALSPFRHNLPDMAPESDRQRFLVSNITLLKEQGTLILRDTQDLVDEMLDLLQRVDSPEEQLMLTALIITGNNGLGDAPGDVPADLAEHLSKMVPFSDFQTTAIGMVRTSVRASAIEIKMDNSNQLRIRPEAFDVNSSTLTAKFEFQSDSGLVFDTRTSIHAGEYTVLGASGGQPLFCVLRIEVID